MLTSGFYITAELKIVDSKKIAQTLESLNILCEHTIKESGCTLFQLHHCLEEPTRLLLWERYDTEYDYHNHFEQAHTKAYLALNMTEVIQLFKSNVVVSP